MGWLSRVVLVNRFDIVALSNEQSRWAWVASRALDTLSEYLGSAFIGLCVFVAATVFESVGNFWAVAVAYGLGTAIATAILAPPPSVARTHGNGVVSLAAALLGLRSVLHALLLLAAQMAGYLSGAYLTRLMLSQHVAHTVSAVSHGKTFWVELLLGSVVGFGYLVVTMDAYPSLVTPRDKLRRDHYSASLVVGVLVVANSLIGLLVGTTGVLHFWHYLGPAIVEGEFAGWWVYALASLAAALVVAFVYWLYEYWINWVIALNAMAESQLAYSDRCYRTDEFHQALRDIVPPNERAAVEPLLAMWTSSSSSTTMLAATTTTTAAGYHHPHERHNNTAAVEMASMATADGDGAAATMQVPVFMATSRRDTKLT